MFNIQYFLEYRVIYGLTHSEKGFKILNVKYFIKFKLCASKKDSSLVPTIGKPLGIPDVPGIF